jgi:hypothetical protein
MKMNDRHQENQSVTPTPLVRDEGVGGSNPLTPTINKLKKLFTPAQPTAQGSFYSEPGSHRFLPLGADDPFDFADLPGYLIYRRGRGSNNPLAVVFDPIDADRIVSCLNAMEARQ